MSDREHTRVLSPRVGDALLVVDLQRDFLSSGTLPVHGADRLLPIVNRVIHQFHGSGCPVIATRDWHPGDHCSFVGCGGPWEAHCVKDTAGAEFAAELKLPGDTFIVSKGTVRDREALSAFSETGLADWLRQHDVWRLYVCGVATDYCVFESARDAMLAGFEVVLLGDCIAALNPQGGRDAIENLLARGAFLGGATSSDLVRPNVRALLTDLYQLTMLQGYFDQGMDQTAVFEFFVRKLPPGRNFLMAAGLEQTLEYLESLHFAAEELDWLASCGRFRPDFIARLERLRFTGDVHAMPEGTLFFPHEPILRVTAPLPEAQLVESRLINILHFQTLVASKAARSVLVAPDKLLVDFGMRRAHGAEAALLAARAAYLAGFSGTATVEAGQQFSMPVYGTMAHSFVQAHDNEVEAFEHFALSNPDNVVLLLDTYDTEAAAEKTVEVARRLKAKGIEIKGVRLDSGDLAEHACRVRRILDDGGLPNVTIFASGNLDEFKLHDVLSSNAPIDGFGIGSRLDVSADAPYLDCAYKLQEYAGRPRRKRSEGKATWPGRKQVYRTFADGVMTSDVVTLEGDPQRGQPLLCKVMKCGRRAGTAKPLRKVRQYAAESLAQLPPRLRQLEGGALYSVDISRSVRELARSIDQSVLEGSLP